MNNKNLLTFLKSTTYEGKAIQIENVYFRFYPGTNQLNYVINEDLTDMEDLAFIQKLVDKNTLFVVKVKNFDYDTFTLWAKENIKNGWIFWKYHEVLLIDNQDALITKMVWG